jgi:hypothetical protein
LRTLEASSLTVDEFIRRFLIHLLPKGFHRIRHYCLFASANRAKTIETAHKLLNLAQRAAEQTSETRSDAAARAAMPLLRRPYVRHRDLRTRLPAPSSANRTSRRNQHRHLMIANTISRIIARVPRRSSTGDAAARLSRCPALHLTQRASPKHNDSTAHSKPITRSGAHNNIISAPQRLLPARRAAIKSP